MAIQYSLFASPAASSPARSASSYADAGDTAPVSTRLVSNGLAAKVSQLRGCLDDGKLTGGNASFAASLVYDYQRYGSLTDRQSPWVDKLIAHANGVAVAPVNAVSVGSFDGVVALFSKAQLKLKRPKIRLSLDGVPVTLSVAGPTSKAPGSINVAGEGQYPNRMWYGRVSPSGQWEPSGQLLRDPSTCEALKSLLVAFAADPAGIAKEYGVLTGNCCFCGAGLSDARSTAAGFGPTCAESYGLAAEWKKAASLENDGELFGGAR